MCDHKAVRKRGRRKEDLRHAVLWYRKSAEEGYAPGQCNLAVCYLNGNGWSGDAAAVRCWRRRRPREMPGHRASWATCAGTGRAPKWMRRGPSSSIPRRRKGCPPTPVRLGYCYEVGSGTAEDKTKPVEWRAGAARGHATAQCNLAYCYEQGIGVAEDKTKAVEWYARAPSRSTPGPCATWACAMSTLRRRRRQDSRRGSEKAPGGVSVCPAQCNLGFFYDRGVGVAEDAAKAVEWYERAAEQGYPRAQCNLGYCYESGKGVKEDKTRAVKLYRQAAEQGSSVGQCNLGYCMLKGIGIRPDPAQAVLVPCCRRRWPGRAMCPGDCYREGQGVEADAAQARTCYQKAIDLGFDAKEELEELDKAAPAGAAEQPKKKKSFPGRLFGK